MLLSCHQIQTTIFSIFPKIGSNTFWDFFWHLSDKPIFLFWPPKWFQTSNILKQVQRNFWAPFYQTNFSSQPTKMDNLTNVCFQLLPDEVSTYEIFRFWINDVIGKIVGSAGLVANLAAILILTRKQMSSNFNLLLTFLAVSDSFFIIFSLKFCPILWFSSFLFRRQKNGIWYICWKFLSFFW